MKPLALRVALVASVVVAALGCEMREPPPPPPPSIPKMQQDLVDIALRDCFLADCERAFAHVNELPPTSTLRQSDAFRAVRYRYDADRLLHADVEPDPTKRALVFKAIADSTATDTFLRLAAGERLARIGAQPTGTASELSINATPEAMEQASHEAADLLKKSQSKDREEQNEVRRAIEPKIFSGKATPGDVAMMRTVCKAQKDATCLRQLDKLLLR